jgi:DnaK suppressor protein
MTRLASGVMEERYSTLLALVRQDLDDVEEAMRRLEDGSYGRCDTCGTALSIEQLESRPASRRCTTCT